MSDWYGGSVVTDVDIHCWKCDRYLAKYASRPWRINCHRCKSPNVGGDPPPGAGV